MALVLAIAGLYVGDVVVAVDRGGPPSASTLLSRARRFTAAARTVRFTVVAVSDGTTTSARGAVRFPDRYRARFVEGGRARDELLVGGTLYGRPASAGARWKVVQGNAGADVLGPLRVGVVVRAVGGASLVRRVSGGGVLRGHVPARVVFSDVDAGPSLTVDVTVSRGGRVVRLDLRLRDWDTSLEIAAPPQSRIDRPPDIDAAAVNGYHDVALLQPAGIPEGWVLQAATVLSPEDTVEGCSQVELDYGDPDDPDHGYLTLFEFPPACASPVAGGRPFRAGAYVGAVRDEGDGVLAQFVAGSTLVQAGSDLPELQLASVMAQLQPLDLSQAPAPIPGLGQGQTVA